MKNVLAVSVLVAFAALAGCVEQNFVATGPGAFTLDKTTRQDVYSKVGSYPNVFGVLHKHGKTIKTMSFVHGNPFGRGIHPDVTPARAETFYFVNNVLVGMDYTSSYTGDGTDFDAGKIALIKNGKTTKDGVIALLGKPGGLYAPPLISAARHRALVYKNDQYAGIGHVSDKTLLVSYDRNGVVTDVEYTSMGKLVHGPLTGFLSQVLSGLAGSDFDRTKSGTFALQKTTRAEVFKTMGIHPSLFGAMRLNGKVVKTMAYAYADSSADGPEAGTLAERDEKFFFSNNVLVGMQYVSSFKGDATDFDAKKVAMIKAGKSTKDDVIRLLGPAAGRYAPPLIPSSSYRGLVYSYDEVSGLKQFSTKDLVVTYGKDGVVTDVKYTAQRQNWSHD